MMTASHFSQPAESPSHAARCPSRISSALDIKPPPLGACSSSSTFVQFTPPWDGEVTKSRGSSAAGATCSRASYRGGNRAEEAAVDDGRERVEGGGPVDAEVAARHRVAGALEHGHE